MDTTKRFFQWCYYQGGIGLVLVFLGLLFLAGFTLVSFYGNYNWIALLISIVLISIGSYVVINNKK